MQDVLKLNVGSRPWLPNEQVTPGEVLDEYDVPLAGLLHAAGSSFLFVNILGDAKPVGIWAYVALSDMDIKELLSSSGPDQFEAAVEHVLADRCVTVALASSYELSQWSTLDAGSEGSLAIAERFLSRLQGKLKRDSEETEQLAQDPGLTHA